MSQWGGRGEGGGSVFVDVSLWKSSSSAPCRAQPEETFTPEALCAETMAAGGHSQLCVQSLHLTALSAHKGQTPPTPLPLPTSLHYTQAYTPVSHSVRSANAAGHSGVVRASQPRCALCRWVCVCTSDDSGGPNLSPVEMQGHLRDCRKEK